jgi:hypothetical protein
VRSPVPSADCDAPIVSNAEALEGCVGHRGVRLIEQVCGLRPRAGNLIRRPFQLVKQWGMDFGPKSCAKMLGVECLATRFAALVLRQAGRSRDSEEHDA